MNDGKPVADAYGADDSGDECGQTDDENDHIGSNVWTVVTV